MNRCLFLLFSLLLLGNLPGAPTASREWTAKTGHKIEARALALADSKVRFERAAGGEITVDLDKLSDDDQELLYKHFGIEKPDPTAGPVVVVADDHPHPLGKTTQEIQAGGGWSYYLYLPATLPKGEKHPVIFFMDPGGGKPRTPNLFIKGATRNRFIVAVSVQSKNRFAQSSEAVDAMIRHVRETLPVDPKRIYTSGYSGGSRMALLTATRFPDIAGVIACGAGGGVGSEKQVVYGLCGTNCFNRSDMASSFRGYGNREGILRYFPGKHVMADEVLIDDALTHLNGLFLLKNAGQYPQATARYVHDVMTLVRTSQETDPLRTFMWTSFLTQHGAKAHDLATIHTQLGRIETNKLYVKGLAGIGEFAMKNFGSGGNQWKADPKTSAACKLEAAKYAGTPWQEVLTRMAEDAQKF